MPNHIQNKLVVTGKTEEVEKFLESIKGEKEVIDFNKIKPMPYILKDTEESTKTNNAIFYYLSVTNKKEYIDKMLRYSHIYTMDRFAKNTEKELQEYLEIGEKYFNIYKETNSITWYDWSLKYWGTKWNAYNTFAYDITQDIEDETMSSVTLFFQTAWSGVPMLIEQLVNMSPELYFNYLYADEDIACNCGEGYGNAEQDFYFDVLENNSEEAFQCYLECWEDDERNFVYEDGYYRYKDGIEEE